MKISIIGAGSPYTPELIEGIAQMGEALPVSSIAMVDIDEARLDIMHGFCQRFARHLGLNAEITKTTDRKEAIIGSTFVCTQIRVGGNEARVMDERIPLSMGLLGQETTGAGGFAKGLRTVPVMLEIARDVVALAPDAWIINYTNPSGMVTQAITLHCADAKIAGLCSGGFFPRNWAAEALGVEREDIKYDYIGLNHLSFAYNMRKKYSYLTEEEFALVAEKAGDKDLAMKIGAIPSPYLSYYYHREKTLAEAKSRPQTRGEEVLQLQAQLNEAFSDPTVCTKPELLQKRGGGGYSEVATAVMDGIYNNRDIWVVANVENMANLPFLPWKSVIEAPCTVNKYGLHPLNQHKPPESVWGLISAVNNYELLTIEAALTGNRDTALLALMAHPLVGDYDITEVLLEKILTANKNYLPNFFKPPS